MALDFSTYDYLEKVDAAGGAGRLQAAFERTTATFPYYVDADELDDRIREILGSVEPNGDDGTLRRTLPKAHPRWNGLFATSISSVQGIGRGEIVEVAELVPAEADRLVSAYWNFEAYLVTVNFETLPYSLLKDESITASTGTYYAEGSTGSTTNIYLTTEYERFVDVQLVPSYEVLSAQTGAMKFRGSTPDNSQFAGFLSRTLAKGTLKLRWFRVPESYLASSNSYLQSFAGTINQTAWTVNGYVFPAGSLLYVGCEPRRYTPPLPETMLDTGLIVWEKVLDLELNFLVARRTATNAPSLGYPNRITAGHNVLPAMNLDPTKFYYVSRDAATEADQHCLFASREFKQLFTDPDF